jgi:hypothetical protein
MRGGCQRNHLRGKPELSGFDLEGLTRRHEGTKGEMRNADCGLRNESGSVTRHVECKRPKRRHLCKRGMRTTKRGTEASERSERCWRLCQGRRWPGDFLCAPLSLFRIFRPPTFVTSPPAFRTPHSAFPLCAFVSLCESVISRDRRFRTPWPHPLTSRVLDRSPSVSRFSVGK